MKKISELTEKELRDIIYSEVNKVLSAYFGYIRKDNVGYPLQTQRYDYDAYKIMCEGENGSIID